MGNSSGKGPQALNDAVQALLETPAAGIAGTGERVRRRSGEDLEDDSEEDSDSVWVDVFDHEMDAESFFQAFSARDATAMSVLQPANLKLLARKALSNISCSMESQRPHPPRQTLLCSIRALTRVFPAILAHPSLRRWCWRRQGLPYLLAYLDGDDEEEDRPNDDDRDRSSEDGKIEAGDETAMTPGGIRQTGSKQQQQQQREEADRGGVVPGGGDSVDADTAKDDGGDDGWGATVSAGDFPVCFLSVALHAVTNLLSFPGFAVDEEAMDWDDHYTPIPALHYGIREACVVWAPGVAVTDQNLQQVNRHDSDRIEALRLLACLICLPLFLETPPEGAYDARVTNAQKRPDPPKRLPGSSLKNPPAALAVSGHLSYSTELFYSLLNLAVVGGSSYREGGRAGPGGAGGSAWRRLGILGGGGGGGGGGDSSDGTSQGLVEWCLQILAVLLRHGRPYEELLEARGVSLAKTGTLPVYGAVPRDVEISVEQDPRYNSYRRCVFVIHSDEDLDAIAVGLLRLLNEARSQTSMLSSRPEAMMIFSAFVHENPRFLARLAASEDLVRGTVVCVCHFLDDAVSNTTPLGGARGDRSDASPFSSEGEASPGVGVSAASDGGGRKQHHPLGEEVGMALLLSRLLLTLTEDQMFMAMTVDTPLITRRGEFSSPALEMAPRSPRPLAGTGAAEAAKARAAAGAAKHAPPTVTLIETIVALAAWCLAGPPAETVGVAAPALAAVVRNACPYLTWGMRRDTAERLLDALETHAGEALRCSPGADPPRIETTAAAVTDKESEGKPCSGGLSLTASPASGVASLVLEGLAAAVAFHHKKQGELMEALMSRCAVDRSSTRQTAPSSPAIAAPASAQKQQQYGREDEGGAGPRQRKIGGIFEALAARGGMLEHGDVTWSSPVLPSAADGGGRERGRGEANADDTWFQVYGSAAPWEGWAMQKVLWPLMSRVVGSTANSDSLQENLAAAAELMACARRDVLRPAGLCPPWGEIEGEESAGDEHGLGGRGSGRECGIAAAAVADADMVEAGLPSNTASAAAPPRPRVSLEASLGEGGDDAPSVPTSGLIPGGTAGGGVLTRVVAVEEPWQSIYLWSSILVKTTADISLFDSRTVKLFEVVDEEEAELELAAADEEHSQDSSSALDIANLARSSSLSSGYVEDEEGEDGFMYSSAVAGLPGESGARSSEPGAFGADSLV